MLNDSDAVLDPTLVPPGIQALSRTAHDGLLLSPAAQLERALDNTWGMPSIQVTDA